MAMYPAASRCTAGLDLVGVGDRFETKDFVGVDDLAAVKGVPLDAG